LPVIGQPGPWGPCRLLVVDSLPRTAIEHHVINFWKKKKKKKGIIVCTNLINRIYPWIDNPRAQDDQYFLDHIILCSKNNKVHNINKAILQQFNPNVRIYMLRSVNFVSEKDRMHYVYPAEFF